LGILGLRGDNQIANYAVTLAEFNIATGDKPPSVYFDQPNPAPARTRDPPGSRPGWRGFAASKDWAGPRTETHPILSWRDSQYTPN